MGPTPVWHYIDTIYASSAALARRSRACHHAVAARKAAFLACLHATLVRSCFAMLTHHTAERASADRAAADAAPTPPPDASRPTTPEPDEPVPSPTCRHPPPARSPHPPPTGTGRQPHTDAPQADSRSVGA